MEQSEKVRENKARRTAKRLGYQLRKSRARLIHANDHGGYMIIDLSGNYVVAGSALDLTLDDVEEFLATSEGELVKGRQQ